MPIRHVDLTVRAPRAKWGEPQQPDRVHRKAVYSCDHAGCKASASYGFNSRWFCLEHRAEGEAFLVVPK